MKKKKPKKIEPIFKSCTISLNTVENVKQHPIKKSLKIEGLPSYQ